MPGQPITLHPHTFHRPPFNRLPPWHNRGVARRVIGYEPGRVLWEVELEEGCFVVWDWEVREIKDGNFQDMANGK